MSRDDGVAPLGRYHSRTRCYRCGTDAVELELVTVRATHAWAWSCTDRVACERRYYRSRQLPLFSVPVDWPAR